MSDFLFDVSEYDPDEFRIDSFRDVVSKHWSYLGTCNGIHYSVYQRDDDVWQIEAAPPFQIVFGGPEDGKKVWTPFEIDLAGLMNEPDIEEITVCGAMTYSRKENTQPFVCIIGTFKSMNFALRIFLVPFPDSIPSEIIDCIKNEVRCISEEPT